MGSPAKKLDMKKLLKPVLNAADEILFGTDKTVSLPHIVDYMDIKRFMFLVVVALLPIAIASVYFWGLRVLLIIAVSYVFGGMVEVAFAVIRKKQIHEGFLVTGLIFPLILPPTVPLWIVAVGIMFGVLFGKEVFGGTGRNIFNPAIVGRIFLSVSFPKIMTVYWQDPFSAWPGGFFSYTQVDAVAAATPLAALKNPGQLFVFKDMLLGGSAGCIGETFRVLIILCGIFLILIKIVDWRIPFAYLSSVYIFPSMSNHFFHTQFALGELQVLSGGLLFGAFFMATDPVTSPFTKQGRWIAGVFLGILTVLIRQLSGYVEGVMFAILLVNVFTPLIDTVVLKARYRKIT